MGRTYLSIHDASWKLYAGLPAEEQRAESAAWKTIETPSIAITVFAPRDDDGDDA